MPTDGFACMVEEEEKEEADDTHPPTKKKKKERNQIFCLQLARITGLLDRCMYVIKLRRTLHYVGSSICSDYCAMQLKKLFFPDRRRDVNRWDGVLVFSLWFFLPNKSLN